MRARSPFLTLTALVLSAALLGCSTMCPPAGAATAAPAPPSAPSSAAAAPPSAPRAHPTEARHVYRLDFVLSSGDGAKPAPDTALTLHLEEEHNGEIHLGTNVAISPQARMDVGLMVRVSYTLVGDDLLLHSVTEMSSFEEPSTVHKLSANGDALVTPGKQALVTSIEDGQGHQRYHLKVTATKLR